jgi:hypothetical protein
MIVFEVRSMTKDLSLSGKVAIALVGCGLLFAFGRISRAQDVPNLGGQWTFNPDQSDDAQAAIRKAQGEHSREHAGSGRGYPGGGTNPNDRGGYPGGGGGYPSGGMGGPLGRIGIGLPGTGGGHRTPGGTGSERRGLDGEEMEKLSAVSKELRIEQRENQVVMTDDLGDTRTLYPDGKTHTDKDVNGKKTSTKSEWVGKELNVESKVGHSGKLTESFRVNSNGKQLIVLSRLDDSTLEEPIIIRRVYDRAGTELDENVR